jgi:hypothetical protein
MIPGFFRQMPRPKAGRYVATVRTFSHFGPGRERHRSTHNGRLRAYLTARISGFFVDIQTQDTGLGVRWSVEKDRP